MNRRRITWLVLLMATALAFIFSHLSPVHGARSARIVVGKDVGDAAPHDPAKAKASYDSYFDRVNYPGTIVLSGTNAMTPSQ